MSHNLRMLFVTRKWPPAVGGMETYSVELVSELERLVDLTVMKLPGSRDGRPSAIALAAFSIRALIFLTRKRRHFDAVHFADFVLFPLAWWHSLIAPRTPRFVTVHGLDLVYGNRPGLGPAIYRCFVSWAGRRRCVSCFIANSRNTADIALRAGLAPVKAIPLGVRVPERAPPMPIAAPLPYVLFVGRLVRRKGAAWFAESVMPRLPAGVEFHVVGKTWDAEEERRLRRADWVKLHGFVSDEELAGLKAGARAIVMPNLPSPAQTDVEGFGLVALEAAISGAPLAAADTEGLSDAVVDKRTGFLLAPGDAAAWADQVSRLLRWTEAERAAFTEAAIETVRREFSWRRVAEATVATYCQFKDVPAGRSGNGNGQAGRH